jgi:outer membrane receptor for ferrienterochelin and colicins
MPLPAAALFVLVAAEAPPTGAKPPAPTAPREVHRIEELVVTGSRTERSRAESTAAVEVIGREEIEAAGAETVADILETHPGVELERSYRGFTVRLQGLDPEYVLVLVDGERAQGRLGGSLDMTRFPVDAIERIEIVKGAGSALYGSDAVAGVINIITRRAKDRLEAGGHVSGGTLGAMDVSYRLGARRDSFDALVTFGHHRGASWDLSPDTPATTSGAFKTSNLTLKGRWTPGPIFQLGARGEYLRRDQNGIGGNETGALFDQRTLSEQASATFDPQWRFPGGSRLHLVGHYGLFVDQFLSDQRGSDALDQYQKTREHLAKGGAQLDLALGTGHLLTTGSEVLHERMRSPRIQSGAGERTRGSVFAQHDWRVFERPRLALQPGVRLDGDSQFGVHVSPKAALRYDPREGVVLRASYGWGYRAPSFQELYLAFDNAAAGYMVAGNPDLEPERSRSANLGAEWRPTGRWLLSLGGYRSAIEDLIIVRLANPGAVGVPARYSYENVARAHTQGIEAGVGAELLAGLRLDLAYTITLARDEENDRPLEGRARDRGTFRVSYRHDEVGLSAQVRGVLAGRRPFYRDEDGDGAAETHHSNPYATVGARISQVVWKKIEAFVGAENLLGAGDELYLPLAPRSFYLGLDFRY